MILADDSPLNRLPVTDDVVLIQMLDGIRYSIAMADLSYTRLESNLAVVFQPDHPRPHRISTAAFLDAWSFVDSINRLRNLLEKAISQRLSPEVRAFVIGTAIFRKLRNEVQHMEDELRKKERLPIPGTPATWGTLACLGPTEDPRVARFAVLIPGTRAYATADFGLAGEPYPVRPADSITLTAHGNQASLTKAHRSLERVTRTIEATLPRDSDPIMADTLLIASTPYDLT